MLKKLGIVLIVASMCLTLGYGQTKAQAAVTVAPGGIGDLLLFPIYDVTVTDERVGIPWENYFVIRNTENAWVACHLRFRAGTKSIEVYDHILLLSPYDVFYASMVRTSGGGVTISSMDTGTLRNSGIIKADEDTWNAQFSTELLEDCGFTEDLLLETERGYIETIGLWSLSGNTKSDITKVVNDVYADPGDPGAINVFDMLYEMWGGSITGNRATNYTGTVGILGDTVDPIIVDSTVEDCPDVLSGSMEMGDVQTGMYQLENFVALNGFRTDLEASADHRDDLMGGEIVFPVALLLEGTNRCYTTTEIAWYANPDYATTVGPTIRDGDDLNTVDDKGSVAAFNLMWSLDDVEIALAKSAIWSYYLNGFYEAETTTDVVLTLPTKHHHFMFDEADLDTITDTGCEWTWWKATWPTPQEYWLRIDTLRLRVAPRYEVILNGPIFVEGRIWDTDENYIGLSPGPSPSPWTEPYLAHEVNVVRVGDAGDILATEFEHGQFRLEDWFLLYGDRGVLDAYSNGHCYLPIIGLTIRTHHVSGAAAWRSSMTEWQYVPTGGCE